MGSQDKTHLISVEINALGQFVDGLGRTVNIPDDVLRAGGKATATKGILVITDQASSTQPIGEAYTAVFIPYSGDDIAQLTGLLLGTVAGGGLGTVPAGLQALSYISTITTKLNQVATATGVPVLPPSFIQDIADTTDGLTDTQTSLTEFVDEIG